MNISRIQIFFPFFCLSVCLFLSNKYPINVKKAEPIGPKVLYDLYGTLQGRFIYDRIFKNLLLTNSMFDNFEIRKFLFFVLRCIQRENINK